MERIYYHELMVTIHEYLKQEGPLVGMKNLLTMLANAPINIDFHEEKLLKEMDDRRKNPVTYVKSHWQMSKELLAKEGRE